MDAPMRSLLYTPGHRTDMVARLLDAAMPTPPDVALLDLEEGVPAAEKENARAVLRSAITPVTSRILLFVRVGRSTSGDIAKDLAAVVRPGLVGIVLPKVGRPEELVAVDEMLLQREKEEKLPERSLHVIASIESAAGLLEAPRIARAPRLIGLMFGSEDFALDMGLPTKREGEAAQLLYARSAVAVAAAAAKVLAFDGIWANFKDEAGLRADSLRGRRLGFVGRQCIHPGQVPIVNASFSPSAEEIEHAKRVVAAFDAGLKDGHGVVALDGAMLDAPIVDRARRVLKMAGG
jgi:citrate lyase subunit beta/citryl-CoA lyase